MGLGAGEPVHRGHLEPGPLRAATPLDPQVRDKGILLMGEPGGGKTLLAHIVLDAAIERFHTVRAVRWANYVGWQRKLMEPGVAPEERQQIWHEINRVDDCESHYMLIDDVGKEGGNTDWAPAFFREIMRRRGDDMLPTIVTTNLGEDEIVKTYGKACWSHLNEVCVIIPTGDEDHRQ